jgi:hypothetical protein
MPLHHAIHNGDVAMTRLLLSAPRIEVNCRDGDGKTPLHIAAAKNNIELVTLLLETGKVDITIRGNDGVHFYLSGSRQSAQRMRRSRRQSVAIRPGRGALLLNKCAVGNRSRSGEWSASGGPESSDGAVKNQFVDDKLTERTSWNSFDF